MSDEGKISFKKGDSPVSGAFQLPAAGVEVNANWKSSSTGQKGLLGGVKRAKGQDLDLVCIGSQGYGPKTICWWGDKDPMGNGGLISHGDDRRGKGGETIAATWDRIPAMIDRLTWMLVAYKKGVTFGMVNGVTTSVLDPNPANDLIASFMPDIDANFNCMVIGQALRLDFKTWNFAEANAMSNIARGGPDGGRGSMLAVGRAWAEQGL